MSNERFDPKYYRDSVNRSEAAMNEHSHLGMHRRYENRTQVRARPVGSAQEFRIDWFGDSAKLREVKSS